MHKSLGYRANQEFTISLWIRADDLSNAIILSRQNLGTTRPGIEISITDGGRIQFDLITRWLAGVGRATTKEPIQVGEWFHLTLMNDGSQSSNGQRIYINGQIVETVVSHNTNSNVGGVKNDSPMMIGGGVRPGSSGFRGSIRDLRLFNKQLWPEEILVLGAKQGDSIRLEFAKLCDSPSYSDYVCAREELDDYVHTLPTVMVMQETPRPKPTHIRKRGVYDDLGAMVERNVPAVLPPMPDEYPRNRLGFAMWLVSKEHPLTSRVAVNRYWQKYFGQGLVKTVEDFGVQGETPSHPRLLDWLATEFVRTGWNVAAMQKLIVTSRTYRQRSHVTPELLAMDPDNRFLARGPRLRLNAHTIRDQALFVSGLLTERIGGPSVSPYQPPNLWAEMSMGIKYKQSTGADLYRRSIYTVWKRTVAPPTMSVLDAADREACWVRRKETNTPLQALTLLNETAFVESARHLAVKMLREGTDDPIGFGFQTVTGRTICHDERRILEAAFRKYEQQFSKQENAEKLLRVGDSPVTREFPPKQLAAFTSLANVLLNLDEVITKE